MRIIWLGKGTSRSSSGVLPLIIVFNVVDNIFHNVFSIFGSFGSVLAKKGLIAGLRGGMRKHRLQVLSGEGFNVKGGTI